MQRMMRLAAVSGLAVAMLAMSGCLAVAAAGAGAAGYAYVDANTEEVVEAPPEQVVEATRQAFEAMDFRVTEIERDPEDHSWTVHGKTATGSPVKVTVEAQSPTTSKVWARVGTFGDEEYSRTVMARILQWL